MRRKMGKKARRSSFPQLECEPACQGLVIDQKIVYWGVDMDEARQINRRPGMVISSCRSRGRSQACW